MVEDREHKKQNKKTGWVSVINGCIFNLIVSVVIMILAGLPVVYATVPLALWAGADGLLGLCIRTVGTVFMLAIGVMGALVGIGGIRRPLGLFFWNLTLIVSFLSIALYIQSTGFRGFLLFPKASSWDFQEMPDFTVMVVSAWLNPLVISIILWGISGARAFRGYQVSRAVARMEATCPECGEARTVKEGSGRMCPTCLTKFVPAETTSQEIESIAEVLGDHRE